MRKRKFPPLLAAWLSLVCLVGCGGETPSAQPYEGTWYFAKNAVECQIGDGKIYQDDLRTTEGQSLRGVYSEMDGCIEAHLAGVGGVQIPRELYVVQAQEGEVLCDDPDGDGTVYFYRDALAAMAAMEAAEEAAQAELIAAPSAAPGLPTGEVPIPSETAAPSPGPVTGLEDGQPSPAPQSAAPADKTDTAMVWVPKSGSKYHSTPSCSGMKDPSQITKSEAESRGYAPCKRCY